MNTSGYAFVTEFPIGLLATTDFLNLVTSGHEIEKPSLNSSLTGHLYPNTWSHSILRQNNSHGNTVRDRDALIIHWYIDDLLTVSETT